MLLKAVVLFTAVLVGGLTMRPAPALAEVSYGIFKPPCLKGANARSWRRQVEEARLRQIYGPNGVATGAQVKAKHLKMLSAGMREYNNRYYMGPNNIPQLRTPKGLPIGNIY